MKYANREYETLAAVTRQASRAIDDVTGSSAKISRQNTSTLFGIVGGFLGLGAAYVLSLTFPVSLPAVGVILTGLGISGGGLGFRLSRGVDIEYRLDRNRIACDEILDRIKHLPPGTPKDVRDQLWLTYRTLNAVPQIIAVLPSPATKTRGNAEPPLLPAPTRIDNEGTPNRDTSLIRIEATLVVASILGSRKPRMPAKLSSRVLRHERVERVCLTMV